MRSPRSVHTYLVGLIVAVALPLLGFSGFLVMRSAEHEQNAIAASARYRTHAAAAEIESQVASLRLRLLLLAGGLSLQTSDLVDFYSRAKEAFGSAAVTLSSADGEEIVNTAVPYGEKLPNNPDPSTIRYVADHLQPRIADMVADPVTHRPIVTINVPVTRDSQLVFVLSVDISPALPEILARLDLPDGWVASIFDRQYQIIGRNRDSDRFIGALARPEFRQKVETEETGSAPSVSLDGVPVYTFFARMAPGGWTINIGVPRDILLAPVRQSTWTLLWLGLITLTLAVLMAAVIGRRLVAPVIGLVPLAEAVGRGEPAIARPTRLTEANLVARSLVQASEQLRHAADERETAAAAIREREQMYRSLAEVLARVDEERTALLDRVVVAQENERKRVARELHDSLAQYLTALRLKLDTLGESGAPRAEVLNELRSMIGELGDVVNRMAWELRPVALDELGLSTAIEHYLEEWGEMGHLEVDLEIDLGGRTIPPAIETTLFRVLQEATTNVLRHSHATRVGVVVEVSDGFLRLIVEDNGKGFPVDDPETPCSAAHRNGLRGMRERLALVHGELEIESSATMGTTLFASVPLDRVPASQTLDAA